MATDTRRPDEFWTEHHSDAWERPGHHRIGRLDVRYSVALAAHHGDLDRSRSGGPPPVPVRTVQRHCAWLGEPALRWHWKKIGHELGISAQSAQQRYGPLTTSA